jgi:hypothetical protein
MHLKSRLVKRRSQPTEERRPKKLLDQVRDAIRLKRYSYRTEQAYVGWIKRCIWRTSRWRTTRLGYPRRFVSKAQTSPLGSDGFRTLVSVVGFPQFCDTITGSNVAHRAEDQNLRCL